MARPTAQRDEDDLTPQERDALEKQLKAEREEEAKQSYAQSAIRVIKSIKHKGWWWPGED